MNRKIYEWPCKYLGKISKSITEKDLEIAGSIEQDLIDTCNINMGVGLAAPQIGILKRIIVIKPNGFNADNENPSEYNEEYMTLINPVLDLFGKKRKWKEACLSLPETSGNVMRRESCKVTYMNLTGEVKTFEASWPFSGGLQHECDHLDGKLYISLMERSNKNVTLEKLKKNRKKRDRGI